MSENSWGVWLDRRGGEGGDGLCFDGSSGNWFMGTREQAQSLADELSAQYGHMVTYTVVPHVPTSVKESGLNDILRLATALHAEEHLAEVKHIAADSRQGETPEQVQHRAHGVMWSRESPAVREAYSVRAVGLPAWMVKR